MKWFLSITAVLSLASGLALGALGHMDVLIVGFLAFALLLCCANLDRISEFSASAGRVHAKTREVVDRAETAITELQLLAAELVKLSLSLVKRQGRIGSYSDVEAETIRDDLIHVLEKLNVGKKAISDTLREWHEVIEFDYAQGVLGNSLTPDLQCQEIQNAWRSIRSGGIKNRPTVEDVRRFLTTYDLLDGEREELLLDYQHYCAHRTHRRPDIWARRKEWSRLAPKARELKR